MNIKTGETALDTQNPGDVSDWLCDSNSEIRGALAFDLSDGSSTIRVRDSVDSSWHDVLHWTSQDAGSMVNFSFMFSYSLFHKRYVVNHSIYNILRHLNHLSTWNPLT